jgi:hypothetical protein
MKDTETIQLLDPDELSVDNAYRSLPRMGTVTLETLFTSLGTQLEILEQTGFAGMQIKTFGSVTEKIIIGACKGKQGVCYDTGRQARYLGTALAALDDDHHLLIAGEEVPVCEKTAALYSLPSYRDLVRCTGADKNMLANLQHEPKLFDCDNYETSLEKLYSMVRVTKSQEAFTGLFYPGPFRLLVLADGTLIHRGRINKIPARESKKLMKSDGLFRFDGQPPGNHESFIELYQSEGPRCLIKSTQQEVSGVHDPVPDFTVLRNVSRELKNRILRTIDSRKDYFILTGSNREDKFGCCPSDEVTMADNLVRAGILSASREASAADACPVTLYAFRNEMVNTSGDLRFNRDTDFRQGVRKRLKNSPQGLLKTMARWALLGFVMATLILAIARIAGPAATPPDTGLYERLDVSRPNSTILVLFHYTKRCNQCLTMEKYAREVLDEEYHGMMQRKQIEFRQVVMDQPGNRNLVDRFGLFTSTLVIIRFEDMEVDSSRVLDRSWDLYTDEMAFKKMLREELDHMTVYEND